MLLGKGSVMSYLTQAVLMRGMPQKVLVNAGERVPHAGWHV